MAMLAEKRYKTKYILNPKSNDWSKDESKFGQKMLEKMGWSKGKGLGSKLDGMVDHVKVSYKNDSKGMGFQDNGEQWTQHEDQFAALLKELNNSEDAVQPKQEDSKLNLEERSKKSKKRVHYHKFTRGKDLSRYSQKDLANIFGRTTLEKKVVVKEEEPEEVQVKEEKENDNLKNGGSMADYFRKKMAKTGLNKINIKKESNDSEEELGTVGFGFGASVKKENDTNSGFDFSKKGLYKGFMPAAKTEEETSVVKEPKEIDCSKNALYRGFVSAVKVEPEEVDESNVGKKKRKLDANEVEDNCDSNKKKKKKKKCKDVEVCNNGTSESIPATDQEAEPSKKKKKKKKSNDVVETSENIPSLEQETEPSKKQKKKKKKNKDL
ncbi:PREDICTED: PIN2/TERF1-interacting telomerase inhibitor 1-like [Nicrophorus vespilloides]|uniref:PIN2/TERF1-interacting telomerase inhibitor 1-like n=1 Tax=Nicrophorus vespilloides TaxID=110193 RepID=A0ABM1MSB6_NICVS|nr:PREDICTED: PIN2/TERF1-interacting telomerase inhibitor 1-like [Nicrophorus vespilloides]